MRVTPLPTRTVLSGSKPPFARMLSEEVWGLVMVKLPCESSTKTVACADWSDATTIMAAGKWRVKRFRVGFIDVFWLIFLRSNFIH